MTTGVDVLFGDQEEAIVINMMPWIYPFVCVGWTLLPTFRLIGRIRLACV